MLNRLLKSVSTATLNLLIFLVKSFRYLCYIIKGLQINLYLEQPMEIQLFATFFQRRK
jgi:hypothetical protein